MAAKKPTGALDITQDSTIKKLVEQKKAVIGIDRTMKRLRTGRLSCVFITANAPAGLRRDIEKYASLANVKVIPLAMTNEELGVICRKPFKISVLSVVKE